MSAREEASAVSVGARRNRFSKTHRASDLAKARWQFATGHRSRATSEGDCSRGSAVRRERGNSARRAGDDLARRGHDVQGRSPEWLWVRDIGSQPERD